MKVDANIQQFYSTFTCRLVKATCTILIFRYR